MYSCWRLASFRWRYSSGWVSVLQMQLQLPARRQLAEIGIDQGIVSSVEAEAMT